MILAIDTTAAFGSLALCDGERLVDEVLVHAPDGFSAVLFPRIEDLLRRQSLSLADIECFAAAIGPGSFTGVRVGLTAVMGLAEASGRPVVGVSNLRAIASYGTGALRAAVLDARRGEVFGAVYSAALDLLRDEVVAPFGDWAATLPAEGIDFVAQDWAPFAPAVSGTRLESAPVSLAPRAIAAAVGRIAAREWKAGRARSPEALEANYVRRSDAEKMWAG